ncbi:Thiol-disulfide oxidoreductase ResA [Rubripirellula lacrimiformis]|uniref:Thiol-disulfide oxidoreductase ResA n=1 Tax=Rubripirellula lacrimiformis TaxID=1930273 RepID=A0A517NIQ7_9BACT|nr:TlpA disulfide reductase family protein [Rubripirellula lacrimiformis]QDT07014.1 Thiol-disulfide oxidoreductase ResA [Rubripirellula lacrimiformis]
MIVTSELSLRFLHAAICLTLLKCADATTSIRLKSSGTNVKLNADASRLRSVSTWLLLLASIFVCTVAVLAFLLGFPYLRPPMDPVTQQQWTASERELEAMVGQSTPAFVGGQWVGGTEPVVSGKPRLLFFWATWCSVCDPYLIDLQNLVGEDVVIIGMHPAGTEGPEVVEAIHRMNLSYPTFLSTDERGPTAPIAGFPVTFFPYSILVDSDGKVVSHGPGLGETKEKLLMMSQRSLESK